MVLLPQPALILMVDGRNITISHCTPNLYWDYLSRETTYGRKPEEVSKLKLQRGVPG
jgi:hypothetical protein